MLEEGQRVKNEHQGYGVLIQAFPPDQTAGWSASYYVDFGDGEQIFMKEYSLEPVSDEEWAALGWERRDRAGAGE